MSASWTDLTGFQRDVLVAICKLAAESDDDVYGLAIKHELEADYGEVNHGHLYPNLDELVAAGLVDKGQLDRRTNSYVLTDAAEELLEREARNLCRVTGLPLPMTDGGESVRVPETDGETTAAEDNEPHAQLQLSDLSAFQTRALFIVAELTDSNTDCYGLAIMRRLEDLHGEEVNHGRLYPNLDTLVDEGLVEKGQLDRRTNSYEVTDEGRRALRQYLDWQADCLGVAVDGGSR